MKIPLGLKVANNLNGYLTLSVTLTVIFGGIIYYLYALNWLGIGLALVLIVVSFIFSRRNFTKTPTDSPYQDLDKSSRLLLLTYGFIYLFLIIILISSRSDRALISPWQVVGYAFFWFYSLASLILVLILDKNNLAANLKIFLIASHYFISFSVALIVYKIAYGFDPFIHQATMELISAKGLVLPKPPYYLGEYGLIVILSKISGISIAFLNKTLVPFLSACLLPPAIYRFLIGTREGGVENKPNPGNSSNFLTVLFLLALGSSLFVLTTPQNFSYLFLILTILAGLGRANLLWVFLLALATAVIHPLTGLPALGWAIFLIFKKYRHHLKTTTQKIISLIIWLFVALALPLALLITSGGDWHNITFNKLLFLESIEKLGGMPGSAGREDWLLNFVYFLAANYSLLLITATIIALLYFYRNGIKRDEKINDISGLIFINSGLLIAYFLSSQVRFVGLIGYEQNAYAERIPIIMAIFFLPFLILVLRQLITRIRGGSRLENVLWLIFGLAVLTASLYLSYPRFDKYWNSRGYSTSASDLAAVKSIAGDAKQPYLVLANQQVSAAALTEFGFDHYYQTPIGPLYFYPIPTGGPLYQYYLDMVYKNPDRRHLEGACRLAGENPVYLIINKYWYQSGRLINEAKLAADRWWAINNEVYIFRYHCSSKT